jgi:hypothetical protein
MGPRVVAFAVVMAAACSEVVTMSPAPVPQTTAGGGAVAGMGGVGGADEEVCADAEKTPLEGSPCEVYFYGYCSWFQRCKAADFGPAYGSVDDCVLLLVHTGCTRLYGLPGQTWTEDDVRSCGETMVNAPCACFWSGGVCSEQLGTLPEDAVCGAFSQCASGYCAGASGPRCGTCRPKPGLGESCPTGVCDEGLQCHYPDRHCVVPKSAGEACNDNNECARAQVLTCISGLCAPPLQEGDNCSNNDDDCLWIDVGLTCSDKRRHCVLALPYGDVGDPCDPALAALDPHCKAHLYCDTQLATCQPKKDVGEPCSDDIDDLTTWAPCRNALLCENGGCVELPPFDPMCN